MKTNKGAVCLMLVALCPVLFYVLRSDWLDTRASDGFTLGVFPLAYLLLAMVLLIVSLFDQQRNDELAYIEEVSLSGVLRISALIVATINFAFLQERGGFIPSAVGLAVVALLVMGVRSVRVVFLYSMGTALLFFGVFYLLGYSVNPLPRL